MAVYHLKHSTHREQARWMRGRMEWNEKLKEEQAQEVQRKRQAELLCQQADVMDELMSIDPQGWEAWYDDDRNVPAYGTVTERIEILRKRVAELKAQGFTPEEREAYRVSLAFDFSQIEEVEF